MGTRDFLGVVPGELREGGKLEWFPEGRSQGIFCLTRSVTCHWPWFAVLFCLGAVIHLVPSSQGQCLICLDLPGVSDGKESAQQCGRPRLDPWVGDIRWRRARQHLPVFLSGEAHAQRSLEGLQTMGSKSRTQLSK